MTNHIVTRKPQEALNVPLWCKYTLGVFGGLFSKLMTSLDIAILNFRFVYGDLSGPGNFVGLSAGGM